MSVPAPAIDVRPAVPPVAAPQVTIIVLVYKRADLVGGCLESLARNVPRDISHEVIVVANGMDIARLADVQRRFPAVRLDVSAVNLGFAGGCNRAARKARGRYLALLNDDAEVEAGWLETLLESIESAADIGAVGSRILLADGSLQEAGSVIWSDGSTIGVGRGLPPGSPSFSYLREVDYCSAASLLVRRDLWDELGGMDEEFHPAYCEDVDFCLSLRARGYRVLYEPRSRIRHRESASGGSHFRDFLIERNRLRLRERWAAELTAREPPPSVGTLEGAVERAIMRSRGLTRRLLLIDDRYPQPGLGSGLPRMLAVTEELCAAGAVSFYPTAGHRGDPSRLERLGIDVVAGDLEEHLALAHVTYDVVIVSRPHNFERYAAAVRRHQPRASLVYDVEALFHRRMQLQAKVTGSDAAATQAAAMRDLEFRIAVEVDHLVCISDEEAALLAGVRGHAPIDVVPPRRIAAAITAAGFHERRDALMAAAWLHKGADSPNLDGALWFVSAVLPRVRAAMPWFRLLVTGGDPPPAITRLAGPNLQLLGHVDDLSAAYARARVVVVPVRFGAGVKNKTVEALLHGVPTVSTSVGAEGIDQHGLLALDIADDPGQMADRVVDLLRTPSTWAARRADIERLLRQWEGTPPRPWSEIIETVLDARGLTGATRG